MCKEKATGEILAMKIRKKDVVVGEDPNIYTLKEKKVLFIFQIKSNPFLLVRYFSNFIPQSPFLCPCLNLCRVSSTPSRHLTDYVL